MALKLGLPVGFPRQPLGPTVPSFFPGNDTFHFEHVKGGKAASYNLGVRMNGIPEHWLSLKQISYCAFHIRNLLQRVRMWDHSRGLPLSQFFKKTHCTNSFGRKLLTNAMDFFPLSLPFFFFSFYLRITSSYFLEVLLLFCWRRKWQPTPAFLPGESHGRRSLVGCSPWGHTESDTTEAT